MRSWITVLVAAFGLSIAACANSGVCYDRTGMLPDERKVLTAITHGQAGRDLAAAVFAGDQATVRQMLAADPQLRTAHVPPATYPDSAPDGQFGDLLTFAVARCDTGMVDLLLQLGVPADGAIPGSPLTLAVQARDLAIARQLLAAGAHPDQPPGDPFRTMYSATLQSPEALELLLAHGADPDRRDSTGTSILQTTVDGDAMRSAEVLIRHGGDPWLLGPDGVLPVQGIAEPLILHTDADEAARQRLLRQVRRSDRPWPPPSPRDVRRAVAEDRWPIGDTPAALVADIKAHAAQDRANPPG